MRFWMDVIAEDVKGALVGQLWPSILEQTSTTTLSAGSGKRRNGRSDVVVGLRTYTATWAYEFQLIDHNESHFLEEVMDI